MPRQGINYLDVAAAATKLMEQDKRPTIEEVRKVLGTGSNSTINRHLRDWREKQGNQIELEQGLPESLLIAVKGIHAAIKEEADSKIKQTTENADQTIKDFQAQLSDNNLAQNKLSQEKHALEKEFRQLQAENLALQQSLDGAKYQIDKNAHENIAMEIRINDKQAEVERTAQQVKYAQKNLDHYRDEIRQERKADTKRFELVVNKLEKDIKQSRELEIILKAERAALQQQITQLKQDYDTSIEKLAQVNNDCKKQTITLESQEIAFEALNEKYNVTLSNNKTLLFAKESDNNLINELKLNIENTDGRIKEISVALKKAEDSIENLSAKNMFIAQEKATLAAQLKQVESVTA